MTTKAKQPPLIQILFFAIPFLLGCSIDLLAPSLPVIAQHYQAQNYLAQLLISTYIFAYGAAQLVLGILSDGFGRRKILLSCAFIYVLISLMAAFAPNIYLLLIYRFLQGVTLAGMATVIRAVATDLFQGAALRKSINTIAIAWSLGPIIGPFVGSYLQHYFNWQADFIFFAIYGVLIFFGIKYILPETQKQLMPFNSKIIVSNIKQILTSNVFILAAILSALLYPLLIVFNLIAPFVIENVLKLSVITYGRIALSLGIACLLGNITSYFLIEKFKSYEIIIGGVLSCLVFSTLMLISCLVFSTNLFTVAIPSFFIFFSCAIALPNAVSIFSSVSSQAAGSGSGIGGTFLALSVAIVSGIAATFHPNSIIPLAIINITITAGCIMFALLLYCSQKAVNKIKCQHVIDLREQKLVAQS